ncbi:MAG: CarD family transcriptional regulator [Candidatus Paracaedibacteraceae bacterium]|jgi:CarD family transcriptional regulator|nr:CarD family transcriptional regulator [Candidatus Paracaedibacteraceae bacterium]
MDIKNFKVGQYVIYPTHGLGQVVTYESQEVAGIKVDLVVISFEKDKMLMRIPLAKAKAAGLRSLSSSNEMGKAFDILSSRVAVRKGNWSRRAVEYEGKINSGDPLSLAEVIRELYKPNVKADQSFSERQIYKAAIDRFSRELAAIESIDQEDAVTRVEELLKAA